MSASAMLDGVMINLRSASVLSGSEYVSTNYYPLERTSACCAVCSWGRTEFVPQTFGTPMGGRLSHTIRVEGYLRDNNNPVSLMDSVVQFSDLLVNSLISDNTAQGSVDVIQSVISNKRPNEFVSAGGATWIPIYLEVVGFEFTD